MAHEIELKLEIAPGDADALETSAVLHGSPAIAKLNAVYFDTPDHAFSKSGYSLRIRRSGAKRIQTIKADSASTAGLFVRSEWEQPVKGNSPVLDHATPISALLGNTADTIAPVFEVHVERRTWIIDTEDATIELALDRGEVVSGDRHSSICEIELELKAGNPATLFDLARRIDAVVPVRLGVMTKAERGYGLTRQSEKAFKAGPVVLAEKTSTQQAFQHIVQTCMRQFRLNEAVLLVARDATALHQSRVALRRLRSALSIFRPLIGANSGAALQGQLRWLAATLGDARNLDVLLSRSQPGPVQDRISAAREGAYDRVDCALRSARVRALMLDLSQWTVSGDWLCASGTEADRQQSAREFADRALKRYRRKVKKGGRNVAGGDDEARHEVRKDAKKLRYAAEFFSSLFASKSRKRRCRKFVARLEALQNHLGTLNDLSTGVHTLQCLGLADDPGATPLLGKKTKKALIKAAATAHEKLMEAERFWQ
jgi:triphosphatase